MRMRDDRGLGLLMALATLLVTLFVALFLFLGAGMAMHGYATERDAYARIEARSTLTLVGVGTAGALAIAADLASWALWRRRQQAARRLRLVGGIGLALVAAALLAPRWWSA